MALEDYAKQLGYRSVTDADSGRTQWYLGDRRLRSSEDAGGQLANLSPFYDQYQSGMWGTEPYAAANEAGTDDLGNQLSAQTFQGPDGRYYIRTGANTPFDEQMREVGGRPGDVINDPRYGGGIEVSLANRVAARFRQDGWGEKILNNMPIIAGIIFAGAAAAGALGGAGGVAAGAGEGAAVAGAAEAAAGAVPAVGSTGNVASWSMLAGDAAAAAGSGAGTLGATGATTAGATGAATGAAAGAAVPNGFIAQQLVNAGLTVAQANTAASLISAGSTLSSAVGAVSSAGGGDGGGSGGGDTASFDYGSGGNWYDSLQSNGGDQSALQTYGNPAVTGLGSGVGSYSGTTPSFNSGMNSIGVAANGGGSTGSGFFDLAKAALGTPGVSQLLSGGLQSLGGYLGSRAQAGAVGNANDLLWRQYQQNREDLTPYRMAGYGALGGLVDMTTPGKQLDRLRLDPGYDFRLSEGQQALDSKLRAGGKFYSGTGIKAAADYNQNFASNEFNSAYNRLAALAGTGQSAANTTAQLGQNTAQQAANNTVDIGNARASGYGAIAGGLSGALNSYNNAQQTQQLFDLLSKRS